MTSLHGAFSFKKMNGISVFVGQYLELNVVRRFDVFFDIDGIIAKSGFGLGARTTNSCCNSSFFFYHPHPFSTATCRCFYHHRKAYFINHFDGLFLVGDRLCGSRNYRHASGYHSFSRCYFITHTRNGVGIRSNKNNALGSAALRKSSIFRKETITRMNGVGAGAFGNINYLVDVEVTFT